MENNPSPQSQATQVEGGGKVDGSASSTASLDLKKVGEILGTTFDSPEKALESLQHLKGFVGDQKIAEYRKSHDEWTSVKPVLEREALAAGFDTVAEYVEWYQDSLKGDGKKGKDDIAEWREQRQRDKSKETENKTIQDLQERLDRSDFKAEFGDPAMRYFDDIKAIAKARNISLKDAYEKSPFKELVEASRTQDATSVVEKNNRVSPDTARDGERLTQAVLENSNEANRHALVDFMRKNLGI